MGDGGENGFGGYRKAASGDHTLWPITGSHGGLGMSYRVVIFEVEGGTDKWLDGRRKDSMPIVRALERIGIEAEVLCFRPEWINDLNLHIIGEVDAYISRVNPGTVPGGEAAYFDFLRGLSEAGVLGPPHPDEMATLGAKDVLAKLADTALVPSDTFAYYDFESLYTNFPKTLAGGQRVLKQNRGSTGEGIWHVVVDDPRTFAPGEPLPLDTMLKCTEAVDNHVEQHTMRDFLMMCVQYVLGESGMLVDMRFMPRIVEGEIRILMVGMTPVFVVHKKPAETEGAFSATLFSGAQYTYDRPERWQDLVDKFLSEFPTVQEKLGEIETPLIWTADFMLDTAPDGSDRYVLGEFNCSCVGFTSHLDEGIQDEIAAEVLRRLTAKGAPATEDAEGIFAQMEEGVPASQ